MTNEQLITEVAINIYGKDAVTAMLEKGEEIPLHTAQGWTARGPYRVKEGETGHECKLWRKKKRKNSDTEDNFYRCKSLLFSVDQIEKVAE